MQHGSFNLIIGAQAGSEAKGKASAYIAGKHQPHAIFMASSPNAGHTFVDGEGNRYVTYHLPSAAFTTECPIYLGPSSLINPDTLLKEVKQRGPGQENDLLHRLYIDERASIISKHHIALEEGPQNLSDIGSTLQGVGTARSYKMLRFQDVPFAANNRELQILPVLWCKASAKINGYLRAGRTVWCEMTQGFDLDLEHGIHPRYCTSKMINPSMAMAEAGVNPRHIGDVYGVVRPYPIRVSNRTGTSGPYAEAREISWEDVARECGYPGNWRDLVELTTTTKLPRRVFEFSWERFEHFCRVCGPTKLVLQFANYLDWANYGATHRDKLSRKTFTFIEELEKVANCRVVLVGTGPKHEEMVEL